MAILTTVYICSYKFSQFQMQYNPSLELGSRMKWNQPMGSPKSMQNIGYEHKYEQYPKSAYISSPKSSYNMQIPTTYPQQSAIETAQLRLTISQLRNALQTMGENAQRLQQELVSQRQRVYELTELKRRLEDELQRAQFELDRISNYDSLQQRQCSIKLETAIRENTRMAEQIGDLMDQNKRMKNQQRKLMSEVDQLTRERAALVGQNQELQRRLGALDKEIQFLKQEIEENHSNMQKNRYSKNPSKLNFEQGNASNMRGGSLLQGPTYRSQNQLTLNGSQQALGLQSLPEQEQVDYERQSKKLLQDYQKLLVENESMKKLYNQFYKNDIQQQKVQSQQPKYSLKKQFMPAPIQPDLLRSFSNHRIAQKLNSPRHKEQDTEMFKTYQREELKHQLQTVRQQAVDEIRKCYLKSVGQAENQKKNSLKIFNQELNKNIAVFSKLAENYLELRETVRKEIGSKVPPQIENLQAEGASIFKMYTTVKQKAKVQGIKGLSVAIFRLLTLLSRCKDLPESLCSNLQHSALKYVYKLSNPEADN